MTTELAPITARRLAYASRELWLMSRWARGFGASDAPAFFGCGWKGKGALAAIMEKVEPLKIEALDEKQEMALLMEPTINLLDPAEPALPGFFMEDAPDEEPAQTAPAEELTRRTSSVFGFRQRSSK